MCHGVGQDGGMVNVTKGHKSEQCPLCPTCASWWVFVCVWGGGGCHCHEATKDTLPVG